MPCHSEDHERRHGFHKCPQYYVEHATQALPLLGKTERHYSNARDVTAHFNGTTDLPNAPIVSPNASGTSYLMPCLWCSGTRSLETIKICKMRRIFNRGHLSYNPRITEACTFRVSIDWLNSHISWSQRSSPWFQGKKTHPEKHD